MLSIEIEGLETAAARALVAALNAELTERYPEEGANHFRLEAGEVAAGRGVFLVARRGGVAVGCGAVRLLAGGDAEVKRMYTIPEVRGQGVGKAILVALEGKARELGASRLVLETGVRQAEAVALYERAGFVRIPAFGEYVGSPLSVCMARDLGG